MRVKVWVPSRKSTTYSQILTHTYIFKTEMDLHMQRLFSVQIRNDFLLVQQRKVHSSNIRIIQIRKNLTHTHMRTIKRKRVAKRVVVRRGEILVSRF